MDNTIRKQIQDALPHYQTKQIHAVIDLLEAGNTIPFIARYRKEQTQALDEVAIKEISDTATHTLALAKRKTDILHRIMELEKLTPSLQKAIEETTQLNRLEELYQPYKQKRRTKAMIAKENGLVPLAQWIQTYPKTGDLLKQAAHYCNEQVLTPEDALQGAQDIIAESINEKIHLKKWIREHIWRFGKLATKLKKQAEDEEETYRMYYEYEEKLTTIVPHRVLAMNRGEKAGILSVKLLVDDTKIKEFLYRNCCPTTTIAKEILYQSVDQAYKKAIFPAIEREIRNELTEKADAQAIHIFGENLRNLLLQSPLKNQIILGLDPAYRTGCKLAIIDQTGSVLHIDVIYPHPPASEAQRKQSKQVFKDLLMRYNVNMVAIGNGTASRESEQFVADCVNECDRTIYFTIVSEAGASIYSASDVARKEFPDLTVEKRSAISIARRLQDPLAELVKIDPQSVGVGQYQHDVSQTKLKSELEFVVETVVNQVGVDVNTASAELLVHIAGLTKTTAENIVAYRMENGPFKQRKELEKVPRLGPKAFEQAIGFLRIFDGLEPLDQTAIHPESYPLAEEILSVLRLDKRNLGEKPVHSLLSEQEVLQAIDQSTILSALTLHDLYTQLLHPRADIREKMPKPILRQDVLTIKDVSDGMQLTGTVRNVVDFGAFVDIGLKQDGLVHVSKMSTKFVKNATTLVSVGDIVTVWVEAIDLARQRVSLTMIDPKHFTTKAKNS